jgi:Response regulator containing a CheY-like receiver domain and an HTH DNA-binding domain
VLIVDDHELERSGVRVMLDDPGIEIVGEASTGRESIEQAQVLRPDVVLMDIGLPDMDGLEATAAIRRKCPQTSVVILTGHDSRNFIRAAIEAGALGYLTKGATREVLVQAVKLTQVGGSLIDAGLLSAIGEPAVEDGVIQIDPVLSALAPRELEVLRHLANGHSNRQIAESMNYSVGTVKNVVQRVIEKLAVADRTQAAVLAVRAGLDT